MEALPKRGYRLCRHCGTVNGNRAYACKSCREVFCSSNDRKSLKIEKRDLPPTFQIFCPHSQSQKKYIPYESENVVPTIERLYPSVRTGAGNATTTLAKLQRKREGGLQLRRQNCPPNCTHIEQIKDTTTGFGLGAFPPVELSADLLHTLPFPPIVRDELQLAAQKLNGNLIRRVSEESFLVQNVKRTQEHQFGLMHVRLSKTKGEPSGLTFHCPCSTYKRCAVHCKCTLNDYTMLIACILSFRFSAQTAPAGGGTTPRLSKRCSYFYLCLWAVASDEHLSKEFPGFVSQDYTGIYYFSDYCQIISYMQPHTVHTSTGSSDNFQRTGDSSSSASASASARSNGLIQPGTVCSFNTHSFSYASIWRFILLHKCICIS